jgi:hypothetical protein
MSVMPWLKNYGRSIRIAVNKIMDVFVRITANDKALSEVLQARPAGVLGHLLSAELHAHAEWPPMDGWPQR